MPEEKQDPANTQMFRAFVERGEQERTTNWTPIIIAGLVIAVVVVLIGIFALA